MSSRSFQMSEVETQRCHEWVLAHNAEAHGGKHPYAGAAGGALTYEFTPTGLGCAVWVRCMCGATGQLTDFDTWG